MADELEKKDEISKEETDQLIKDSEEGSTAVAEAEAEPKAEPETDEKGDEKSEEFEIVRESGESQPPKQQSHFGIRKRINKLNAQKAEANGRADTANHENAVLKEQLKIQAIALQQARDSQSALKQPDPAQFEEGANDPKYQEQLSSFNQEVMQREVKKQVSASTKTVEDSSSVNYQSQELEKQQVKHYERAAEIGAKDYSDTEDKAIEILGTENVNHIINNFPDSQFLLYYLGKNPHEAERIMGLIDTAPILGAAELGRLSSELKVKTKSTTTPNPDEEIQGGEPAANVSLQRQLDKLRTNQGNNPSQDNMRRILDFKKKIRAKGIELN